MLYCVRPDSSGATTCCEQARLDSRRRRRGASPTFKASWPLNHLISTPFQRPERFGERRFLTEEEFAAAQKSAEDRNERFKSGAIPQADAGAGHAAHVVDERPAERTVSRAHAKGQGALRQDARQLQARADRIRQP